MLKNVISHHEMTDKEAQVPAEVTVFSHFEQQVQQETMDLLLDVYHRLARVKHRHEPPQIDVVYRTFREEWLDNFGGWVDANPELYDEIDDKTLASKPIEEVMAACGLPVPGPAHVHHVLNLLSLNYTTNDGAIANPPVIGVW